MQSVVLLKTETYVIVTLKAAEVARVDPTAQCVSALRAQQHADQMDHRGFSGT